MSAPRLSAPPAPAGERSSCPDENQLMLLAEDALGADRRAALEAHFDGCAACAQLIGELASLAMPPREAPARYRVLRRLGGGAMGVVWEAEDQQLGRRVALKFVATEGGPGSRSRLLREARALAQLRHPNVVLVHDVGEHGEELYLALELVQGADARRWRAAAPRTSAEILAVWRQAAAGLAAVHRAGIVHRDIKPDNVLVGDDGEVRVGDFGLATGAAEPVAGTLTLSGALVGTPRYMAPELLHGEAASPTSDQFALCASLWESVVGAPPFRGATVAALAVAMTKPLELPARPGGRLERGILTVAARGLALDPARRWPTVAELHAALAALAALAGPGAGRRRGRPVAAAAAAALVGGALVAWRLGSREAAPGVRGVTTQATRQLADAQPLALTPTAAPVRPSPSAPGGRSSVPASPTAARAPALGAALATAVEHRHSSAGGTRPRVTSRSEAAAPAPEPSTTLVDSSNWRLAFGHAMSRRDSGDPAGCLSALAAMPAVPADFEEMVKRLHATCVMASGACDAGHRELTALARERHWSAEALADADGRDDMMYCPIEAPPSSRWPIRANYHLALLANRKLPCAPVLAIIERRGIVLPEPHEASQWRRLCYVNQGDCSSAYRLFLEEYAGSGGFPADEDGRRAAFLRWYPSCQ